MGPEADNFRPLGMPNALDRLVDGSVAAHAMHQTAHLMHPSQAVMSYADLSKAFERVNPHWILELLRIKRAPRWLIAYTKFILFHRRAFHKVQGRLLRSRTIMQGVDMEPLFTCLKAFVSFAGHVCISPGRRRAFVFCFCPYL